MRDLLSENGTIYVHVKGDMRPFINLLLVEAFGEENFKNDIVWWYQNKPNDSRKKSFPRDYDSIYAFTKSFGNHIHIPLWTAVKMLQMQAKVIKKDGKRVAARDKDGNIIYEERTEKLLGSIWDLPYIHPLSHERTGFSTQKPEAVIEKIVDSSSNEVGLVADFFCGSGTTLAIAEKLGRRWIGIDLGRYAIHTTRKRMIQVQRDLHNAGKPYRSFDVYNLGRYERQWWQLDRLKGADNEHRKIVLKFYKAATLDNPPNPLLHGKKSGAYIHIAQIDSIFTFIELREVALAAQAAGGRELHCLAWEFEMELALKKSAVEAETGVTIRLKYIPREIMEPNRSECQFFEAGYLEARTIPKDKRIDVELVGFIPALAEAPEKEMDALRERAVRSPFDFIDFWAVDFDYQEGQPFEHHWQDFRTRKERGLKTKTDLGWEYAEKGKHHICVKVIDVFGVDTTTVIEVEV